MEWKDVYQKIINSELTKNQIVKIKKLFEQAMRSGSLDNLLLNDEYAKKCYSILFNDTTRVSNVNNKEILDKLTLQYPYLNNEYISLDDNGIVHIKILDTVGRKNVLRDVEIPLDRFIKLIERERPSIGGMKCPLCGEKLYGECIVSPTGLHYHKRCYDFIKSVVGGD
ncbi:MAG: hypothetical protein DRJ47_06135 [Thermoprotei archaeon]|nr:MAG: hypothetical protein DRJ47_06135 [Thermoprotei archaeon]